MHIGYLNINCTHQCVRSLVHSSSRVLPVTVADEYRNCSSPAPKASDRKLSKSPYLSLGTVQETGELDFSDFEKVGGGGVEG